MLETMPLKSLHPTLQYVVTVILKRCLEVSVQNTCRF